LKKGVISGLFARKKKKRLGEVDNSADKSLTKLY